MKEGNRQAKGTHGRAFGGEHFRGSVDQVHHELFARRSFLQTKPKHVKLARSLANEWGRKQMKKGAEREQNPKSFVLGIVVVVVPENIVWVQLHRRPPPKNRTRTQKGLLQLRRLRGVDSGFVAPLFGHAALILALKIC